MFFKTNLWPFAMDTSSTENPDSQDTKETSGPAQAAASGFIGAVIQSYQHLYRSLIFFGIFFLFLIIALVIFLRSVGINGELKAELTDNGGLVFNLKKGGLFATQENKTFATFLLPSNALWFDTGLLLDPNQECKLRISGTAHLAVHSLVKSAQEDVLNPVPWTTADGDRFVNIGDAPAQLKAKKKLLLKPGDTIGNVLGYLMPEDETNDFPTYFMANREKSTSQIITINQEKTISNNLGKKSRIYLSVNDILLGFEQSYFATSKKAYVGANESKWKASWENIVENDYYNVFFDDNIGCLLVQVEISGKSEP